MHIWQVGGACQDGTQRHRRSGSLGGRPDPTSGRRWLQTIRYGGA